MKRGVIVSIVIGILIIIIFSVLFYRPTLQISDAYVIPGPNSAVYMTIRNIGLVKVCIVGVNVINPNGMKAMLHATVIEENGTAKMVHVEKICIEPFQTFKLEPGRYHIMIMGDVSGFKSIKLKLSFEGGDSIEVVVPIKGKM